MAMPAEWHAASNRHGCCHGGKWAGIHHLAGISGQRRKLWANPTHAYVVYKIPSKFS
jgi:hypothetical protein